MTVCDFLVDYLVHNIRILGKGALIPSLHGTRLGITLLVKLQHGGHPFWE